jgi:hypothetical protein
VLVIAAGLVTAGVAACGDESEQSLTFTVGADGFIQGPSSAEPGLTEIAFENAAEQDVDMQLIWVEGDRSPAEVIRALGAAVKGKPLPDWFFAAGGVGLTSPGESRTVTQVLKPGDYFALNTETDGPPEVDDVGRFEVNGDGADDEVEGDATVSAFEYGFETDGLSEGSEIVFENKGAQPHHLLASPLVGDSTADDVESFFKTEKGKPPFREEGGQTTAVIEGGESQLVPLDLKAGRYVLLCFISDRQGGPPHAFKGMVGEVEVE